MDLTDCKEKGIIRPTQKDYHLIKSLVEMSRVKEKIVLTTRFDNETINGFLPMAYDSLREILEAYCIQYGFKVSNHDCLGKLVFELHAEFDLFNFNRFRFIRNGINYYGTKIGLTEGQQIIKDILLLKRSIEENIQDDPNLN